MIVRKELWVIERFMARIRLRLSTRFRASSSEAAGDRCLANSGISWKRGGVAPYIPGRDRYWRTILHNVQTSTNPLPHTRHCVLVTRINRDVLTMGRRGRVRRVCPTVHPISAHRKRFRNCEAIEDTSLRCTIARDIKDSRRCRRSALPAFMIKGPGVPGLYRAPTGSWKKTEGGS